MKIFCHLDKGGWFIIELSGSEFSNVLDKLKREIHVLTYDSKLKRYKAPVREFENLYDFCDKHDIDLRITEQLGKTYRRYAYLQKKIKRERKNKNLALIGWTKDKNKQLRPYQKKPVNAIMVARRFINGDQMGLGKTPESIAVILKAFEYYGHRTALVVCPARLQGQWKDEILKFTTLESDDIDTLQENTTVPCLTGMAEKYHGAKKVCKDCKFFNRCKDTKANPKKIRSNKIKKSKILICGYETMRICVEDLLKKQFPIIIFDEAAKIKNKNPTTRAAKKISKAAGSAGIVVALSGTVIENRLEELFTICDVVDDTLLGGFHNFKNRFLVVDYWGKTVGYRNEKELKKRFDKIFMRRTIDMVWKDRPPLVERIVECPMGPEQAKIYTEARLGVLQSLRDAEQARKVNNAMLATLIGYLLMVADTVKSIDPECDLKHHSSKIDMLKEMLRDEIPRNDKVVIFSRFANKVIPYLVEDLKKLKMGDIATITGSNSKKCDGILKRFNTDPDLRILVCSDAMAYGANLQVANHVINVDMPWNPAKVDQRIARVYRGGQTSMVIAHNLIVPDTFEEYLYAKLADKRELAAQFIKPSMVRKAKSIDLRELAKRI